MDALNNFIGNDNPFMTVILFAIACKFLIELFSWFWNKVKNYNDKSFNKEIKDKNESETIKLLQNEIEQLKNENGLLKKEIEILKNEVNQFKQNRTHDRSQSLEIQNKLMDKQDKLRADMVPILKEHATVMKTLEALCNASKETLAGIINAKYKEYMAKEYIPEDEFDEFVNLHDAYKKVKGNHSGDMKFNRCMKLIVKHDNEYDKKYKE